MSQVVEHDPAAAPPIVPLDLETGAGLDAIVAATAHARVILLGESSHGDGATFAAKSVIAQHLHEHAGVDVLAWEAGTYDCWRMDRAFAAGTDAVTALALGVHGIWVADETRPLAEYIAGTWRSGRPYRQVGFDTQFSSVTSVDTVGADLTEMLTDLGVETTAEDAAAITAIARRSLPFCDQLEEAAHAVARARVQRLLDAASARDGSAPATRILRDVLCNDDVQPVLNRWIREGRATDPSYVLPEDHAGFIERFGMRDQAMAANLLGELERAPGTRFAGWLANGHAQRDVASINGGEPRFTSLITMGRLLHEALGDELYVLSTTSYSGQMHDGGTRGPTPLEPAAPGSLERALHDTRVRTGFVDVRTLPADSPWRRPQSWRVWGPEQASAALPDLVDGILYIDRQHGAHPARA